MVQIYVSLAQENEDKPYQSLVSFKKTGNIKPLHSNDLLLNFKLRDVARYDIKKACYILDKGKCIIRVGNSSEKTKIYGYIELKEDIITEKLKNIVNNNPDFIDYKPKIDINEDLSRYENIKLNKNDFDLKIANYTYEYKIYNKLKKFSDLDLINLCIGEYNTQPKDVFNDLQLGYGGTTTRKVKEIDNHLNMADGPAGLRLSKIYGIDSVGIHILSPNIFNYCNYKQLKK